MCDFNVVDVTSKSIQGNHSFVVTPLKSCGELETIQEVDQIQIESCDDIWIESVTIRSFELWSQVMKEELPSSIELIRIDSSMDEINEMLEASSTHRSIVKGGVSRRI